jgi:hypothetical protein
LIPLIIKMNYDTINYLIKIIIIIQLIIRINYHKINYLIQLIMKINYVTIIMKINYDAFNYHHETNNENQL